MTEIQKSEIAFLKNRVAELEKLNPLNVLNESLNLEESYIVGQSSNFFSDINLSFIHDNSINNIIEK